jgi:hypothetical protein
MVVSEVKERKSQGDLKVLEIVCGQSVTSRTASNSNSNTSHNSFDTETARTRAYLYHFE